jgi:hypothetical protein
VPHGRLHGEAESISDLQFGRRDWSTLISLAKFEVLFKRLEPGSGWRWVGAKVGANVHSHQAMPGDVQPPSPQLNGTPGDAGYVGRLGGADLGAGGRGFESRHPDW